MRKIKVYIIGSLGNEQKIDSIAAIFENSPRYIARCVKRDPDEGFETLVSDCYKNIFDSDLVIAVPKQDGTFGDGTIYEMVYAEYIGKPVIAMDDQFLNDFKKLN